MEVSRKRTGTEQQFFDLTKKIVELECGYKLYDMEYVSGSSTLRVFIMDDKTKTAVIEDCVKVDRGFTPYCETEAWIPEDFVLEVSSPGMYRELKSIQHFEWAQGELVLVKLDPHKLEGELRERLKEMGALTSLSLRAKVSGILPSAVKLEVDSEDLEIPFEVIKKANLDPDVDPYKE
ncbi:MAG: hypothetical protein CME65_09980 [Halobacteriovoraceae bacterium]|nr:hypothetical protein [Halobacteriovoraceae bacterium]